MEKWGPQNMALRSAVISKVLRLEQTSSSALRAVWRIFKPNSKTLGNTSSALPFKAKIDILYDLEELDSINYHHLIKLMEIRNQFAHNPNAISFSSFEEINKDIFKYLLKYRPKELEKDDIEKQLEGSFNELFKITAGNLLVIEIEYANGLSKQLRQHTNDVVVENLDQIWAQALEKMKSQKMPIYRFLSTTTDENQLDSFYNYFRIAILEFRSAELGKIDVSKGEVFKTKVSMKEHLVWLKKTGKIEDDEIDTKST
ncbi:MAG: hypothetical protein EOP48_06715 [Sphingobacteriales bacterium]|nr:MAG: hypothetical protein EOP48_06715 [Sphingobacteriales bacterium]